MPRQPNEQPDRNETFDGSERIPLYNRTFNRPLTLEPWQERLIEEPEAAAENLRMALRIGAFRKPAR